MLAFTNWAYFSFCKEGIKSPMQPVKIAPDWGRTGVTGPFILAKHVKTPAVLQQALGTFKTRDLKEGPSSPQGCVLLFVWTAGPSAATALASRPSGSPPSVAAQETWSSLSSPPACSHHVQGLCVHVCVRVFMCAHTVLVMGCPLGTVDADLQVTQWEWSCDGRCILTALQLVQRRATFNWASVMEPQRDSESLSL